jgi:hypothetical protein
MKIMFNCSHVVSITKEFKEEFKLFLTNFSSHRRN